MTPSQIRSAYNDNNSGHFFSRSTMRFFGDTMRSFGAIRHNGETYLYRKPSASVNVFGRRQTAGRTFFGVWHWIPSTCQLAYVDDTTTQAIFDKVSK